MIGCYLDYNSLDIYDPTDVLVESTFFLDTHANIYVAHQINGLIMRFNSYTTSQSVVVIGDVKSASVKGVVISDEIGAAKTTTASAQLYQKNATAWTFDFASELLFPTIERIEYSITSPSSEFFSHMAKPAEGSKVTICTSMSVEATVLVTVTQAT